jgi:chemotaxis protein methyltransferase CheR
MEQELPVRKVMPVAITSSPLTLGTASVNATSTSDPLIPIRDLIYKTAGIFQADNKLQLLERHCNKRMKALGVPTLADYYSCLTVNPMHQAEMASLLNEITIGETFFFRNRPQLDAIRKIVLPTIIDAKSRLKIGQTPLRIWSAGCSTGEEPFTLSMMLLDETQETLQGRGAEIIATDLNERSIAYAKAGCYADHSTRNLDPHFRNKYFNISGDKLQVKPEVQANVSFSRLNLLDDARMLFAKRMDLILCSNVLIYFDAASKKRVIQHFYRNLLPHGYLLLGHSESLFGISEDFRLVHMPSATAYVKSEKDAADSPR